MVKTKWMSGGRALIVFIALLAGVFLISQPQAIAGSSSCYDCYDPSWGCGDCYDPCGTCPPPEPPCGGNPCINVTKDCVDAAAPGDPIFFYGTVTNCGDETLFDVFLEDITLNDTIFSGVTLAPGETIGYTGEYVPSESPSTNEVYAAGTGASGYRWDSDTATCYTREAAGCRMTGGGIATAGLAGDGISWDGTFAEGKWKNGNGSFNVYTFGGQVGANTALPPQPKGEWTHHQKRGPYGSFVFHAGTSSAPPGTEVDEITCTDPGWCSPARKAPNKQLDWIGVGSFKNMKDSPLEAFVTVGESLHCVEVHYEDQGEPGGKGGKNQRWPGDQICPSSGQNDVYRPDPITTNEVDCSDGCPDFYRIRIYDGPVITEEFGGPKYCDRGQDVIYEVESYLRGGNIQIHPLTGYDR